MTPDLADRYFVALSFVILVAIVLGAALGVTLKSLFLLFVAACCSLVAAAILRQAGDTA